ncbi:MAG: HD domain-containing protein [Chitinivibrionales bacterium]|nr:HD domain-containing protein [Chitinivibrionales bacterium]
MNQLRHCTILIADRDVGWCETQASFLIGQGLRPVVAHTGTQALELVYKLQPQVLIAAVRAASIDGLALLAELHKNEVAVPVILLTDAPDMASALKALHLGAFDYLAKPIEPQNLFRVITNAIAAIRRIGEHAVLAELVNLHEMTCNLTASNSFDDLLDTIFKMCLQTAQADAAAIHIKDPQTKQLHRVRPLPDRPQPKALEALLDSSPVAALALNKGQSILMAEGKLYPPAEIAPPAASGSALWAPLTVSGQIMGLLTLVRGPQQPPFSIVNLNTINLLAAQAGIALNNATLYRSINQKLSELSLISTYAEQLMGLIDEKAVVQCLFETVAHHFPLDLIAFLIVKKRAHVLQYWARGAVNEGVLAEALAETTAAYNRGTGVTLNEKRGKLEAVLLPVTTTLDALKPPFIFEHIVCLCDEDFDYGVVYFSACRPLENTVEKIALLTSLVSQTRIALVNAKLYFDMKENYIRTIKALAIAVDAKDIYTHSHSENVMHIAEEIAREMGVDEKTIEAIRNAGLLHDIGKIGIPGYVLNKTGPLTYDEFNGIMKSHSMMGANIVKDVPFLTDLHQLILYHHEHFNGGGYPEGLRGSKIPIGARIIHVADAFEAMTSDRPYRKSLGVPEAIRRLCEAKGIQFDPDVIEAFLKISWRKGWLESK